MPTEVLISPDRGHALLFTQGGAGADPGYDAIDDRRYAVVAARKLEGVLKPAGWKVRETAGGPSMQLEVDANIGLARVDGDDVDEQGPYAVAPHNSVAVLDVPVADVTSPRVDRIVLQVRDSSVDGSGFNDSRLVLLPGLPTAGASKTNPAGAQSIPDSSLHFANVEVPAGAVAVSNVNLLDFRTHAGDTRPGTLRFASGQADDGEVLADFRAVRRDQHHRLFAEIGVQEGPGDGASTFNVTDMRGRVPVGSGGVTAGRLTAGNDPGAAMGAEEHQLTTGELAEHAHGVNDPGHDHNLIIGAQGALDGRTIHGSQPDAGIVNSGAPIDSANTGITIANSGGNQPHNNMPPSKVGRWLIYTGSVAA